MWDSQSIILSGRTTEWWTDEGPFKCPPLSSTSLRHWTISWGPGDTHPSAKWSFAKCYKIRALYYLIHLTVRHSEVKVLDVSNFYPCLPSSPPDWPLCLNHCRMCTAFFTASIHLSLCHAERSIGRPHPPILPLVWHWQRSQMWMPVLLYSAKQETGLIVMGYGSHSKLFARVEV